MRGRIATLVAALVVTAVAAHAQPDIERERREDEREQRREERRQESLGDIRGRLVDPAGQGLRGVVSLCMPDGCRLSRHTTWGLRNGEFVIRNLEPGRYLLRTETIGPEVNDLIPGEDVQITVRSGGTIRPRLVARCP